MMMKRIMKQLLIVLAVFACTLSIVKAQTALEGIKAIEVEQFENAKKIFSALITTNPGDASNYFYMGKAFYHQGKIDSAKVMFDKGVEVNPNSSLNMVGLGSILFDTGNDSLARIKFEQAVVSSQAKDYPTLLYIGEAYTVLGKKDFNQAMVYLNKAKALNPKNPEIYVAIGDVYLQQVNGTDAIKNYNEALKLDPNYTNAHVRTGKLYTRALNYMEAKLAFEKAISIDAAYPPIYREYGELELSAKKYESAVENYKKYMDLTDRSLNSQLRFARFLFLGKQYQESADLIKQIIAKDTTDYVIYRLLGYSSYEIKDYKTGLQAMNKFFSMNPRKILAQDYAYLGKLQVKNKMDSLGVSTITKAIEMDTTSRELYGDLADAYFSMKKYKLAAETYQKKIVGKDPGPVDYFYVGRAYYFAGENVLSDTAFALLLSIKSDFPTAWLYRGRNNSAIDLVDGKNTGMAKPYYEKFVEVTLADPKFDQKKSGKDLIEAYKYLGDYYFSVMDDKATSKSFFLKVLEIDPNDKVAKDVVSQLK
jgi:tetratricopeptide (TPR) repeat protein